MASYYRVQDIYDDGIRHLSGNPDRWKEICKLSGLLYRYEFDNILLVSEQRPRATLIADYDTWKKVGRFVKRGSKGIAIFPSRALDPSMRHVFDITDTGGRNVKLTWDLEGNTLKDYADYLIAHEGMEPYENEEKESIKNALKHYIGTNVWGIIQSEFSNELENLKQLFKGRMTEQVPMDAALPKRKGLPQDMTEAEELLYTSVMYAVGTRCGFEMSVQEQDFSRFVDVTDEEIIYHLGSLVCDVSCSVLRGINQNIKQMESERRLSNGRSSKTNDLSRGEWTSHSKHSDAGESDRGVEEAGQVRTNGNEISSGERTTEVQDTSAIRNTGREDAGSGERSERPVRSDGGEISPEPQATESKLHDGDVKAPQSGENGNRGSGTESGSIEVPLEEPSARSKELETQLNKELEEINSFGASEEAGEYVQASFFDGNYDLGVEIPKPAHTVQKSGNTYEYRGKTYTYLEPKREPVVPHEYIKQVVLDGTGFIQGKTRVCKIFEEEVSATERVKRIKSEYGIGGAGWPLDGYGLHGYDTFHGKGVRFQWRDVEGEKEGYVSWSAIEKEIGALILTGEYQPDRPRLDEIAMEGTREDEEIIDAEYRELDEEVGENSSRVDDYAIPDEPESYEALSDIEKLERAYNEGRELTPEEGMIEDRLATMAEYGPEMEMPEELAEDEQEEDVDRSQFHNPSTDYARKVMEMDEDFRGTMEILVGACSCYSPYRAFLMDLVETKDLLMPTRLQFLSDIVLRDREEATAYANNDYGLIEYKIRPFEIAVSYKNRNGERLNDTIGYRELYEVLSYMVKQPYFCGEDQREYYRQIISDEGKSSRNPIYKLFLDKQKEFRENNEKQRQRAIEKGWNLGELEEQSSTSANTDEEVQSADIVTNENAQNFHYDLATLESGGAKTRFSWNIAAITTMKQIESEGRAATPEEQQIMSKFVGWGGLAQAFDEKNESWSKEYQQLKELLTEDEYVAARARAVCHAALLAKESIRGDTLEKIQAFFDAQEWLPKEIIHTSSYVDTPDVEVDYEGIDGPREVAARQNVMQAEMNYNPIGTWGLKKYLEGNHEEEEIEGIAKDGLIKDLLSVHLRFRVEEPGKIYGMNGCCIPGAKKIYVTTNGDYLVCEKMGPSPKIGNVYEGIDVESIRKNYVEDFRREAVKYCKDCWAINLCNICYTECFDEEGVNFRKRHQRCEGHRISKERVLALYHEILEESPEKLEFLNDYELA